MKNFEWLLVFCLGVIWGSSFLFAEILLQYLSPITIVFLRVFFSSCMLLIIILLTKTLIKLKSKDFVNLFIMGLLNNVIPFTFIIYGQQTTTGGMASIINSNTAFAAIIISAIFIPIEKLTISRTLGISIGILGVLIAIGFNNIFNLDSSLVGVSFVALATISYAFAGVWAKTKMSNLPPL